MDEIKLSQICKEEDYLSDDSFVGIRYKNDDIEVVFPMGYQIGNENDVVRRNILSLLYVLSEFSDKTIEDSRTQAKSYNVGFPIFSYIYLIRNFLANGLYMEKESDYAVRKRGKINWGKTIKSQKPYPSNGSFVYLDYVVKDNKISHNELITLIHEACLYRCFEKVGWLYTSYRPQKPRLDFDQPFFEKIVIQSMSTTFNDKKRELFGHLLNVIRNESNEDTIENFTYGTNRFEYVWEKMIDYVFGISEKERYFPHSKWHLRSADKGNSALEPDTIMLKNGTAYILDAKYYKYGITGIPSHLPATSSIAKQIIYAEYIENNEMTDEDGNVLKTYNAFLMPFSKDGEHFNTDKNYMYVGYADADWKKYGDQHEHNYEHVEGILLDINYLINNCTRDSKKDIDELADLIEKSFE